MRILVINGPNLNLLGRREPEVYGSETLADLESQWRRHASKHAIGLQTYQSNHEGSIIDAVQDDGTRSDAIIINPGALSHYSYALYDALVAVGKPTVEVHISNIHEREEWRRQSVTAPAADLVIVGRGTEGYQNAIDHVWATKTHPPTVHAYGDHPDQVIDVRSPGAARGMVALLHGGFWREIWGKDIMDPLAVHLMSQGWATANIEYRRGPDSFESSVADASAAIRHLDSHTGNDGVPLTAVVGHSAGGYLAVRNSSRSSAAVIALGPVLQLDDISASRPDDDPITSYLGASAQDDPALWEEARLGDGAGAPVRLIHGTNDETIPIEHSRAFAAERDDVTLTELHGADHRAVVDPHNASIGALMEALEDLA